MFLEQDEKKGKSGRATALSQELTECLHRWLYTLSAGDDILTSFYRPFEDQTESRENPLVSHVNAMEKAKGKASAILTVFATVLQMHCSVRIIAVSFKVFPHKFCFLELITETMYVFAVTEVKLRAVYTPHYNN